MNKFSFRLEPLYEYRKLIEELKLKDFGSAMKMLGEQEAKLNRIKDEHKRSSSELDGMKEAGGAIDELRLYNAYIQSLKRHIDAQQEVIRKCAVELERRRGEFIEASKEKKLIKTIKDKSLSQYNMELGRMEQKITDDSNTSRLKRGDSR
ncbi:MAG: flagellar export protein FliJ [Deltaproteobacteria bacterium]